MAERGRLHRVLASSTCRPTRARAVRARSSTPATRRRERSVHRPRAGARRVSRTLGLRRRARRARRQPAAATRSSCGPRAASRATSRPSRRDRQLCPRPDLVQLDTQWVARVARDARARRHGSSISQPCCSRSRSRSSSAIRSGLEINNRSVEIEVTKLVGGTDAFIRRPFLYLGLCYGSRAPCSLELLVLGHARSSAHPSASSRRCTAAALRARRACRCARTARSSGRRALLGWAGAGLATARHLRAIEPR